MSECEGIFGSKHTQKNQRAYQETAIFEYNEMVYQKKEIDLYADDNVFTMFNYMTRCKPGFWYCKRCDV